jgi:TldD protein
MFEELERMLSLVCADYADIRHENRSDVEIGYAGPELSSLSSCSAEGFVLRVLKGGGFSSVAFTRPEDAARAASAAVANASVLSRLSKRRAKLAPATAIVDEYSPSLGIDPESIPIEEKIELLRKYNAIALAGPKTATTQFRYFETKREKTFLSTEGARVKERLCTCGIGGLISTKDGSLIQNIRAASGGSDGYQRLLGREAYFEERTRIATDLLAADPVAGGTYEIVLNPSMTGVFTHEAFGHFSEADIVEDSPSMLERMRIGEGLGTELLTIVDDPTMTGVLGHYKYDDEGVPARRVVLMEKGVLKGRLHSRRTAAVFGEEPNGHAVAEDFNYEPIIRMGTIFVEPRGHGIEELFAEAGDGLYLLDAKGGQTAGENFTFGAQYGYRIEGGKLGGMVRDINISGNLYETLKSIRAVGGDFELSKTGGCGKGQLNIRSCHGGPHALASNIVVGGA